MVGFVLGVGRSSLIVLLSVSITAGSSIPVSAQATASPRAMNSDKPSASMTIPTAAKERSLSLNLMPPNTVPQAQKALAQSKRIVAAAAPVLESPPAISTPSASADQSSSTDKYSPPGQINELSEHPHNKLLTPASRSVAEILGLMPLVRELVDLKQLPSTDANELKRLRVKQQVTDAVLIATLQVRDITARLDRQIAVYNRARGSLEDRRDRAIKYNTLANTIGMGMTNELGQALEIPTNEVPGEVLELVAGLTTTMLGALAMRQQAGPKQRGFARPNLLAKVFNRPTDAESDYPSTVWTYLNSVPPGDTSNLTRLKNLQARWRKYGALPDVKKIAALTSTSPNARINIDMLNTQTDLMADLRSEIMQMDRDVLELLVDMKLL